MSDRITLRLLGSFSLTGPEGARELTGRKLRALLAYLALSANEQQPRERLMTLLWGAHFEAQARQNLRQALSRLRRSVGDALVVTDDERVGLDAELIECDVARFEALCADGSRAALIEADGLYRGELLDGLTIPEESWEAWLAAERARLSALVLNAQAKLSEALIEDGDCEGALAVAQRSVGLDPYREDAHRNAMRALAGLGRRAEALRGFDAFQELLAKELGTAPSIETVAIRDAIRSGDLDAAAPQPVASSSQEAQDVAIAQVPVDGPVGFAGERAVPGTAMLVANPAGADVDATAATAPVVPGSPPGAHRWRWLVAALAGFAILVAGGSWALWSAFSGPSIAERFGSNLRLVTSEEHASVLGGVRIDSYTGRPTPDVFHIKPDGTVEVERLRNSSLRQKLLRDTGTWRSDDDRLCMSFKWYFDGRVFCVWFFRDGDTLSAFGPKERGLAWLVREGESAKPVRLVPPASEAGKQLDGARLAELLPGAEMHFAIRTGPVVMRFIPGGQLETQFVARSPKGRQFEFDKGSWRIEKDQFCTKPGSWMDGLERCFTVKAGPHAYAMFHEVAGIRPFILMK